MFLKLSEFLSFWPNRTFNSHLKAHWPLDVDVYECHSHNCSEAKSKRRDEVLSHTEKLQWNFV